MPAVGVRNYAPGVLSWPAPLLPTLPGAGPALRLFDTARGEVVETTPGRTARMYVCGITPYDATHLGHAATYLAFDLVNRVWRDARHAVHYVQNVTDVDDPLFERADRDGEDWIVLGMRETALFREDMTALRVLPPEDYVGAVEAIPSVSSFATASTISGIDSTAPMYSRGGSTRSACMSSRNSAVSRIARTTQSSWSRIARSSSGSSTSVTFCT